MRRHRASDGGEGGDRQALLEEHRPSAIRARLSARRQPSSYLEDAVLGAVDGSISTFATVAGAVGGGFSAVVVAVLGLAKLLADAFSMAVSNYQSASSRQGRIEQARRTEEAHVERFPEGEREEVRELFAQKGFAGETLEQIVATITSDRQVWVETMVREEHGLQTAAPSPVRAAAATFAAFVAVGCLPLLPFLVPALSATLQLWLCGGLTAGAFVAVGAVKGRVLGRPLLPSCAGTLLSGGAAAALAFAVGRLLRQAFGAS